MKFGLELKKENKTAKEITLEWRNRIRNVSMI